MVTPSDPSYVQKLARAKQHFARLEFMLETFVDAHPCPTEEKVYPESKQRVWRVSGPPPDPNIVWSPAFGEFFFNARSALDQLIWAVVRKVRGSEPGKRLSYPIHTDPIDFLCHMSEPLKALPSDVLTIIERSQPYNGSITPQFHSLTLLNELGNIDKHRRPNLTVYSTGGFTTIGEIDLKSFPVGINPYLGKVKQGTVLLTLPQDMEVSFHPRFDICFAEGDASYTRARDVMRLIISSVQRIIDNLQPFA